jgi:hypothetical protein
MATINKDLDKIPNIYDLSCFNKNKTYSLKFVFSIKSIMASCGNSNNNFMKEVYVNDILIDKKYDKNFFNFSYDILLLLKNIKHITNLYNLFNDINKKYDIYILSNTKNGIIINTNLMTLDILNKSYITSQDLTYMDIRLSGFYQIKEDHYLDDNIYINIYIRESVKTNRFNGYIFFNEIYEKEDENICILSQNIHSDIIMYGIGIIINGKHNITSSNKKIKSYTLPIANMQNIFITLDMYSFDKIKIYYYFNKLINHNNNEIISILPDVKCIKCDNNDNINHNPVYNKDNICAHIIEKIMSNIKEQYKQYIKNNGLDFILKFDDVKKITQSIEFSGHNECYSLMKKYI